MTITVCAKDATIAKSWVIKTVDISPLSLNPRMRSMTVACVVTSNALVGSSAINKLGLPASAVAIIARWRIPPESSCGYWRATNSTRGISTFRSKLNTSASIAFDSTTLCTRSASAI